MSRKGFTAVELMTAVALSALATMGAYTAFSRMTASSQEIEKRNEADQELQLFFKRLRKDWQGRAVPRAGEIFQPVEPLVTAGFSVATPPCEGLRIRQRSESIGINAVDYTNGCTRRGTPNLGVLLHANIRDDCNDTSQITRVAQIGTTRHPAPSAAISASACFKFLRAGPVLLAVQVEAGAMYRVGGTFKVTRQSILLPVNDHTTGVEWLSP